MSASRKSSRDAVNPGAPQPTRRRRRKPYRYPAHLRHSPPRHSRCHRCHSPTLTGTYDAQPLRLDPQPLSQLGEIEALVFGHKTWLLANGNLFRRNSWSIKTSPTGLGGTIHRTHICQRPQPQPPATAFPPPPPDADDPGF